MLVAPFAGLLALTVRFIPDADAANGFKRLMQIFVTAVEQIGLQEIFQLFLLGVILGLVAGSTSSRFTVALALSSVALFPALSLIDLIGGVSGATHNLIGLEWLFYTAYALVIALGAVLAQRLRSRI